MVTENNEKNPAKLEPESEENIQQSDGNKFHFYLCKTMAIFRTMLHTLLLSQEKYHKYIYPYIAGNVLPKPRLPHLRSRGRWTGFPCVHCTQLVIIGYFPISCPNLFHVDLPARSCLRFLLPLLPDRIFPITGQLLLH